MLDILTQTINYGKYIRESKKQHHKCIEVLGYAQMATEACDSKTKIIDQYRNMIDMQYEYIHECIVHIHTYMS